MRSRLAIATIVLAAALIPADSAFSAASGKRATTSARLLVPFYEVDTSAPLGATTFFSVRNETTQPVDITISYYAVDSPQAPLYTTDPITLGGKRLRSFNVRSIPNLVTDADGFKRGYVIIEAVGGEAAIQGEYFSLTPDEGFAIGERLVNIDPASPNNELCSVFTIRFLNGGGFSGGTDFVMWLDLDVAPQGDVPVFTYLAYNEAGDVVALGELTANEVAFRQKSADLLSLVSTVAGAMEFQIALLDGAGQPVQGHISATLSASGLYSVGIEAVCKD